MRMCTLTFLPFYDNYLILLLHCPKEKNHLLLFAFITWVILKDKRKLLFCCWSVVQLTAFNSPLPAFHGISSSWLIFLTMSLYYIYLKINREAILNKYIVLNSMLWFFCDSAYADIFPKERSNKTKNVCPFLLYSNFG